MGTGEGREKNTYCLAEGETWQKRSGQQTGPKVRHEKGAGKKRVNGHWIGLQWGNGQKGSWERPGGEASNARPIKKGRGLARFAEKGAPSTYAPTTSCRGAKSHQGGTIRLPQTEGGEQKKGPKKSEAALV